MISKKICHLSSVHSRYDIRVFHKQCCSLASAGYDVSLIIADGKGNEIKNGVHIVDVGMTGGRLKRMTSTTNLIYSIAKKINADAYHFHDPELIPVGLRLKRQNKKVIYDMHEDVPKQVMLKKYLWMPFRYMVASLFSLYQSYAIRKFDATIVPQPTMEDKYSAYGKILLIENFAFLSDTKLESLRQKKYVNLTLCHTGALTIDRGILNMLELACLLERDDVFYLAGNMRDSEVEKIKSHRGWNKITYLGVISRQEVVEIYKKSNLGIILYNNVGQYGLSYAIKLFEYMSYGIPVIMPDFGEWFGFNQENKCGICVNVKNHGELKDSIKLIRTGSNDVINMSCNGFTAFIEKYSWGFAEKKLLRFYRGLVCA